MRSSIKFISIFFLLLRFSAIGQVSTSPYSRFALGDLSTANTPAYNWLGGATALGDKFNINLSNPASYGYMQKYRPLFSFGAGSYHVERQIGNKQSSANSVGVEHIMVGIPIKNRLGVVFGTAPYSSVGYQIVEKKTNEQIGEYLNAFSGEGGLNKALLGVGVNLIGKDSLKTRLSIGSNVNFLFGHIFRVREVVFAAPFTLHTRVEENFKLRGFSYDAGVLFRQELRNVVNEKVYNSQIGLFEKISATVGLTYRIESEFWGDRDYIAYNYETASNGDPIGRDTIESVLAQDGNVILPAVISAGVSFDFNDRLLIAGECAYRSWGDYREVFGGETSTDELVSSGFCYSGGIQFKPTSNLLDKNKNVLQKSSYRVGARLEELPIQVDGKELSDYGITFGIGMPLPNARQRSISNLQFAARVGKRGSTANGLIEERYVALSLGLTFSPTRYDKWFYKRKYN